MLRDNYNDLNTSYVSIQFAEQTALQEACEFKYILCFYSIS